VPFYNPTNTRHPSKDFDPAAGGSSASRAVVELRA
jgi:hypothetical protein